MEKNWHIAYTRFRETAAKNGNWVFSRPVVTDIPWWECPCENKQHSEGEDVTKDIESWSYREHFDTKEEAEAALANFPIEEYELLASYPPLHVWIYADGRQAWEKERGPSLDVLRLDPMFRQCEWENEYGKYHSPPPLAIQERGL